MSCCFQNELIFRSILFSSNFPGKTRCGKVTKSYKQYVVAMVMLQRQNYKVDPTLPLRGIVCLTHVVL